MILVKEVILCFLIVCGLNYKEVFLEFKKDDGVIIFVVLYLFFIGMLMNEIE